MSFLALARRGQQVSGRQIYIVVVEAEDIQFGLRFLVDFSQIFFVECRQPLEVPPRHILRLILILLAVSPRRIRRTPINNLEFLQLLLLELARGVILGDLSRARMPTRRRVSRRRHVPPGILRRPLRQGHVRRARGVILVAVAWLRIQLNWLNLGLLPLLLAYRGQLGVVLA